MDLAATVFAHPPAVPALQRDRTEGAKKDNTQSEL